MYGEIDEFYFSDSNPKMAHLLHFQGPFRRLSLVETVMEEWSNNVCIQFAPEIKIQNEIKLIKVASSNPLKIKAVEHAFHETFPYSEIWVVGEDVQPGPDIPPQPLNEQATEGSFQRVQKLYKQNWNDSSVDFLVGIENGIVLTQNKPLDKAFVTFSENGSGLQFFHQISSPVSVDPDIFGNNFNNR